MGEFFDELRFFYRVADQAESVAEEIKGLELEISDPSVFLDVGSNEGKLTELVLNHLESMAPTEVYAIEADRDAGERLLQRFAGNRDVSVFLGPFQKFLSERTAGIVNRVNLLLNSHTFYYFPPDKWGGLLKQSNILLAPNGYHVIVLESAETSVNSLKPIIDEVVGQRRSTDVYGRYMVGGEFKAFMDDQGIEYDFKTIDHPIKIPIEGGAAQNFARVLAFMFRYQFGDVLQSTGDRLGRWMQELGKEKNGNYEFAHKQDMFILKP